MRIQDSLIRAVVSEFRRRLAPRGHIAWIAEAGSEVALLSDSLRASVATSALSAFDLPNVGIEEASSCRLILIDATSARSPIDDNRREMLQRKLGIAGLELVFVSAFRSRSELARLAVPAWGTRAWFADEPDHFIEFDGGCIRRPH